jgi:hypothetical protein
MATGAFQGIPVEHLAAIRAGTSFLLLFYPFLDSVVFHKLQVFDHLFVVPNPVHHVDFGKVFQSLAWKFRALGTPGYFFLFGAAAKTVPAVAAGGIDVVGKAPVAANFLDGDPIGLGHFL